MPAAHDLFAPAKGDTLSRSRSGLAHSDREIEQMREWIEAGDNSLLEVVAALGDCLKAASGAMRSVGASGLPGMGGPFPEEGLMRHQDALSAVARAAERVARAAKFEKPPFFDRHFIPSGGMPNGLRPRDFDAHRNDETVYDKRRAEAIEGAAARKKEQEAQRAREEEETASRTAAQEERRADKAVLAEFLEGQPAKAKRIFQARLSDSAFEAAALAAVQAVSGCVAMATVAPAKVALAEQRLAEAIGDDADLRAMARYYLENAEITVLHLVKAERLRDANVNRALATLRKVGERIDKAAAKPASARAAAKTKKRA